MPCQPETMWSVPEAVAAFGARRMRALLDRGMERHPPPGRWIISRNGQLCRRARDASSMWAKFRCLCIHPGRHAQTGQSPPMCACNVHVCDLVQAYKCVCMHVYYMYVLCMHIQIGERADEVGCWLVGSATEDADAALQLPTGCIPKSPLAGAVAWHLPPMNASTARRKIRQSVDPATPSPIFHTFAARQVVLSLRSTVYHITISFRAV